MCCRGKSEPHDTALGYYELSGQFLDFSNSYIYQLNVCSKHVCNGCQCAVQAFWCLFKFPWRKNIPPTNCDLITMTKELIS